MAAVAVAVGLGVAAAATAPAGEPGDAAAQACKPSNGGTVARTRDASAVVVAQRDRARGPARHC